MIGVGRRPRRIVHQSLGNVCGQTFAWFGLLSGPKLFGSACSASQCVPELPKTFFQCFLCARRTPKFQKPSKDRIRSIEQGIPCSCSGGGIIRRPGRGPESLSVLTPVPIKEVRLPWYTESVSRLLLHVATDPSHSNCGRSQIPKSKVQWNPSFCGSITEWIGSWRSIATF